MRTEYIAPYVVSAESPSTVFRKTPIGKKNKVLFEESELCYELETGSGIHYMKVGIEKTCSGINSANRSKNELANESLRNDRWMEIRIIDGFFLKSILNKLEWALKIIELIHKPYSEVFKLYANNTLAEVINEYLPRP